MNEAKDLTHEFVRVTISIELEEASLVYVFPKVGLVNLEEKFSEPVFVSSKLLQTYLERFEISLENLVPDENGIYYTRTNRWNHDE